MTSLVSPKTSTATSPPRLPAENAPLHAFIRSREGGVCLRTSGDSECEKSRNVDRLKSIVARCVPANLEGRAANGLSLPPPAPLLGRLQQGRHQLQAKLLAKVDMGLGRGEPPRDRRCRYKRQVYLDGASLPELQAQRYRKHFERLENSLSITGLYRLVHNLYAVHFFESVDAHEHSLVCERSQEKTDEQYLGMWRPSGILLLVGSERTI